MSRARSRPPRLEPRIAPESKPAPPPSLEALIERSKIAGVAPSGPGPTEFRRIVERIAAGDRRALGELSPVLGLSPTEAWNAVAHVYGTTAERPTIDASCTVAATRAAVARVRAVAAKNGARIAIASARPASLLTVQLAFAGLARDCGAEVVDLADFGPIRADGRTPRWLRWIGGVAVVSDGSALCDTRDGEAAREWMFAVPRPSLVIADGPFAEVAWESGAEVVALAGLDHPGLAIAGARRGRCTVVPLHTDRAPRAYAPIEGLIVAGTDDPVIDLTGSAAPSDDEV